MKRLSETAGRSPHFASCPHLDPDTLTPDHAWPTTTVG